VYIATPQAEAVLDALLDAVLDALLDDEEHADRMASPAMITMPTMPTRASAPQRIPAANGHGLADVGV
jgi:hypothetical protein